MNSPRLILLAAILHLAAPPASPAQESAAASDRSGVRLRTGDTIDIRVFKHDELTVKVPIPADGTVAMQFIGSIKVAGLTKQEAESRIQALYADGWFKHPQVTVNVTEYAKASFTVMGEVNRAGTFALPRNRTVTLLEAIGTAGSYNAKANKKIVILKRGDRSHEVNVRDIIDGRAKDHALRDGDVVMVKASVL